MRGGKPSADSCGGLLSIACWRSRRAEHGVTTIVPPSAGKHSRFTLVFEAFAVEGLQTCRIVKAAAALLGFSWDAVQTIVDRAVASGLEQRESKPTKTICIDEKSLGRVQDERRENACRSPA